MTGLTEARAALERGRSVIVVVPPAVEHAALVWDLAGPASVIVCGDAASAVEWADAAPADRRVHSVTGLARSQRILQSRPPDTVAGAAKDLAALVTRSALKLDRLQTMVIAWPEVLVAEHGDVLDTLLSEAGEARRIVLSWDPSRIAGFLDRHAYRAPMVGSPALDAEGRPARPLGPAAFSVVPRERRTVAVRAAIDSLNVGRCFVWHRAVELPKEAVDAILCVDLPSREEFAALSALAEPILLVSATQLPYARSIAAPLKPLRLPSQADLAQDRAEAVRTEVARLLDTGDVDAELTLLAPLFERYDPTEVAAALLRIRRPPSDAGVVPASSEAPAWVRVFVGVGKKDGASAKDLVGALIREARLAKAEIGGIEVRETFSLVEIAPGAVEKAVRGLSGVTIRGRRVAVRRDRER